MQSQPQPRYQPGDLIGGRFLVGLPARMGGMGEVYLCLDTSYNPPVPFALKTFQQKYVKTAGLRQAFEEEVAHWVALRRHPNIVHCHYMEILDNRPFMVLEWINGEPGKGSDLRGWLRHGALDLEMALNFAIDIVRGLVWAQERSPGITHRDLKPGNILVRQGGRAKITDFGLAAISSRAALEIELEEESAGEAISSRYSMQASGGIAGTPPYMAPEQWQGLIPDPRDDIYALGCILHEMLSGELAFGVEPPLRSQAEAMQTYRDLHQAGEIPALPETVPAPIRELTRCCLEKTRGGRFASMEALLEALSQVYTETLDKSPRKTPPPGEFSAVDYNNRGLTYDNLKRHEQALEDYDRALQIDPTYAVAYSNRGTSYAELGQPQHAIEDFDRALRLDPTCAGAYTNRGNCYSALGQLQRAIEDYDRALQLDPSQAKVYNNRGNTYANLGQPQRAIEDYNRALQLDPRLAKVYINRGNRYADLGQHRRAIKDFSQALQLDPQYTTAYFNRGNTYADLGLHQQAIEDFDRALQLDPTSASAYSNRGASYADLGQHERAIEDYNRALQLDPASASAHSNRGASYGSLGQPQRAIEDYDRALQLDPTYAAACLYKAITLAQIGQAEAALATAQQAHHLGHPRAMDFIDDVRLMMTGQQGNNPAQAAFEAFQRVGSLEELRRAVAQHPVLLETRFLQVIEQFIAEEVPSQNKPAFEERLAWLKQIAKGA